MYYFGGHPVLKIYFPISHYFINIKGFHQKATEEDDILKSKKMDLMALKGSISIYLYLYLCISKSESMYISYTQSVHQKKYTGKDDITNERQRKF